MLIWHYYIFNWYIMLSNLFSSKILFSILSYLFTNKQGSFSTTEIIKATGKNQANILRELEKLSKWGIVTKSKKGNQNYYQLKNDFAYYNQLAGLFLEYNEIHQPGKYFLVNEESNPSLLALNYFLRGFHSDIAVRLGFLSKRMDIIGHYKDNYVWFYFEKNAFLANAKVGLQKLLDDPSFVWDSIYSQTLKKGEEAFNIFNIMKDANFKIDKNQAVNFIDNFSDIIVKQIGLNSIAVLDLKNYPYSNYLKNYLEHQVKKTNYKLNVVSEK